MNGIIPLRIVVLFAVGVAPMAIAHGASDAEPVAMIRGGADVTGQVYTWVVKNQHTAPLDYIAFPHYRGGAFVAPDGWDTSESTFLVGVGVEDRPGVCVARAASVSAGLASGRSAAFRLQLAAGGTRRTLGEVTLRFVDGTTAVISGVELPHKEAVWDQFVTLIGLGVIFAGWLGFRVVRSRGQRQGADG